MPPFLSGIMKSETSSNFGVSKNADESQLVLQIFHFDTVPDPPIRFIGARIRIRILLRIRPKIEDIPTFLYKFFTSDPSKMISYYRNIENHLFKRKKIFIMIF